MEIALYCRSGVRSGATRKSGGAERSGERALQKKRWSGAERGAGGRGAGTERGAEVTGLGWSVERLFRPLRSAHMLCTQDSKINNNSTNDWPKYVTVSRTKINM